MNTKLVRLALVAGALLIGSLSSAAAADAPAEYDSVANATFKALENGSFEQFTATAENAFKKSVKKSTFDGISGQLGPRMKGGYDYAYLGDVKRPGGIQLTLWKLIFKPGGDEMLVAIEIKDGKMASLSFPRI